MLELEDGFRVRLALFEEADGEEEAGARVHGVGVDAVAGSGFGFAELMHLEIGQGEVGAGGGIVIVDGHGAVERGDGLLEAAALEVDGPEGAQGFEEFRIGLDGASKTFFDIFGLS